MYTLFIISDIHGAAPALERAVAAFERERADLLVVCGDYLNHGPRNDLPHGYDTKKTAALLNTYKTRLVGVQGNCDSEVDQMMLDFPCLAPYANIVLPNGQRVFAHHGHRLTAEEAASLLPAGSIIVSGHTHVPVLEQAAFGGGLYTVCNPGSISIPKNGSKPGYLLVRCGDGTPGGADTLPAAGAAPAVDGEPAEVTYHEL